MIVCCKKDWLSVRNSKKYICGHKRSFWHRLKGLCLYTYAHTNGYANLRMIFDDNFFPIVLVLAFQLCEHTKFVEVELLGRVGLHNPGTGKNVCLLIRRSNGVTAHIGDTIVMQNWTTTKPVNDDKCVFPLSTSFPCLIWYSFESIEQ